MSHVIEYDSIISLCVKLWEKVSASMMDVWSIMNTPIAELLPLGNNLNGHIASAVVRLALGDMTPFVFMLSVGLPLFMGYTFVKWVLDLL